MDSVDYTKAINREQKSFYDKLDSNRDAQKKELARVEEQAATTTAKQKETHKKQLDENEAAFKDRIETINKTAKKVIENKEKDFAEKVKGDQGEFVKQKEEQLRDFNSRINNLSDSYRKNATEQNKQIDRVRQSDKNRYAQKLSEVGQQHEKEMVDVYDKTKTIGNEVQDRTKYDKNHVARKHAQERDMMINEHTTQRARERDDMKRELTNIRQNSEDMAFSSQKQMKDNFQRLQKDKEHTIRSTEESYDDTALRSKQAHALEKEKIVRNQKDHNAAVQREFSKEKNRYEQEAKRKSGEDTVGQFNRDSKDRLHKDQLENQQKMYKGNMADATKKFNNQLNDQKEDTAFNRRNDAIHNAKQLEEKEKQSAILNTQNLGRSNKEKADLIDAFSSREVINQDNFNRTMLAEKSTSQAKYNNLKDTFTATVTNLSDKNQREVEDIRTREGQERTRLLQESRAQTNEMVGQIRKDSLNKINKTSTDYERRLEEAQLKMNEMQRFYEDKIAQVRQDAINSMDKQSYIHTQQRKQDAEDMKNQMGIREEELNKTIEEWRGRYNRDLNTVSFDYERKMKGLMSEYENKIGRLMTDQDKEKARMTNEMAREIERNKIAYDTEKSRIVQQYENAIAKLKEAGEAKNQAVEQYKKQVETKNMKA